MIILELLAIALVILVLLAILIFSRARRKKRGE